MATQFENFGFEDLRTYIQNNWSYIAIIDDTNTELLRWDVEAHSSASWVSGPSTNPLSAELIITGQDIKDEGNTLPVTLSRVEVYRTDTESTRTGYDTLSDITVNVPEEEVKLTHNYRIPQ